MTALDIVQAVSLKVGLEYPTVLFASTDRTWMEMAALLNECATEIADAYDWQALKNVATITGDGTTIGHALPTDYQRMLLTANVWSSPYLWGMEHVTDTDRWLEYLVLPYKPVSGAWTIYQNLFQILPELPNAQTAMYFYISSLIVSPQTGVNLPAFVADTDMFVLNEKLLQLRLTARWKEAKNYPSQTDYDAYQTELLYQMDKDGGSKPILSGGFGSRYGVGGWR